jgi:DNA-directed RNA polymerase specialized sigma24 family protein
VKTIPHASGSELSDRVAAVMRYFRRTIIAPRYKRHAEDLMSIAVTVSLESMNQGESIAWACKAARRAFWPEVAYETRKISDFTIEPAAKVPKRFRPIPAWYLARCSSMQTAVIRMTYEADAGWADIGRALDINEAVVRNHHKRGLNHVREVLSA